MASVEQKSRVVAHQASATAKMLDDEACKQGSQPIVASLEKEIGKYSGFSGLLTRIRTLDPFASHRNELKTKLVEERAKEQACVANAETTAHGDAMRAVKKY